MVLGLEYAKPDELAALFESARKQRFSKRTMQNALFAKLRSGFPVDRPEECQPFC